MSSFNITNYDIIAQGAITISELGAYSTVIWQGDDNTDFTSAQSTQQVIKEYLNYGGNFIYEGYRPTRAWQKNTSVSAKYSPGMFIYDYLKVDSSFNAFNSRFIGGVPFSNSYNAIYVDSSKTSLSDDYHLKGIESIFPNSEATAIYKFDTNFDTTIVQGKLKGRPVGVEYIGADYKSIVLSFPLYYMNFDQAKAWIESVLINEFNMVMDTDEEQNNSVVTGFELMQNYPNPFNPNNNRFSLMERGNVRMSVINILGEEIKVLLNEEKEAGYHSVEFNASDLPSGVYIYRIQSGNFIDTKKMLLLK